MASFLSSIPFILITHQTQSIQTQSIPISSNLQSVIREPQAQLQFSCPAQHSTSIPFLRKGPFPPPIQACLLTPAMHILPNQPSTLAGSSTLPLTSGNVLSACLLDHHHHRPTTDLIAALPQNGSGAIPGACISILFCDLLAMLYKSYSPGQPMQSKLE